MTNEPGDFWSATPELTTIYRWARARYAAPWAVFGAVLLRVVASTGPHVQLPGIIGGRASLNLLAVFVAPSGGGKGISDKVARLAWPAAIHEEGLGSGQGIAELFKQTKEPEDRIDRAIFSVSEVDHLTALDAGRENNTRATLKAAAMGERIGSKGASSATSRTVPPHSYRMCLSVGGQPGHCAVILDDATGGTPQRFLWIPSTDPTMPSERTADPEPLNHRLPGLLARVHDDSSIVTDIIYGTEAIADAILTAHLARQRGQGDALDGHWMLLRCKVAAALAIMHHRTVVSAEDWELSAQVMAVSDETRSWVVEQGKAAQRAKIKDRAVARAAGEDFYDASRLETVKRSLLRMLERDGEQPEGKLKARLGTREKRDLFDQAIALLTTDGLVSSRDYEYNGRRITVWSTMTTSVNHEKSSSETMTTLVNHDQSATVTELDSRRSPCPGCDTGTARRDTGRCDQCTLATIGAHEFLVCWFRTNTTQGQWVEPATALTAGKEVGYKHDTLKAAQQRRGTPRIESSGTGRGSKWRLDPANFAADGQSA